MEPCNPACQSQAPHDNGAQPMSHFRFTDLPQELRDLVLRHVLDYLREKSGLVGEPEVDKEPESEAEHYDIQAELKAILALNHDMFALSCETLALDDNTAIRALQNEINTLNNERVELVGLVEMVEMAEMAEMVTPTRFKNLAPAFDNTVVPDNLAPVPQSLATLACVSKEWQKFFEAHAFRNLELIFNRSSTDLVDLGDMVKGYRRAFVENIVLHIELRGHSSDDSQAETETETRKNNVLFTIALVLLFETLTKWTDPERKRGLTLRINVWSPDDDEDWPPRWQGNLLDFIPMKLPLVPIVDGFVWIFCSESTRSASADAIRILLQSMNHLSGVVYHPHYSQPGEAQSSQDDAFLLLFQNHSASMKCMVVKECAFLSKEDNQ
ncbi:F-box domain protein [Colletotrichum kahawae]|uniref:F-box domain protein n=1 Tax=Colletotrichum kahawae TaxID=34407 RepID=A0AAD9YB48_COLKA|nr:F-box domain protein [Colletotrichum kahawae]